MRILPLEPILETLDAAAEDFDFPMLDNGYIYPVACRLRAFRTESDWALGFETFGYSPRSFEPDLTLTAIGTGLKDDREPSQFVDRAAYDTYRKVNWGWRHLYLYPVVGDDWIEEEQVNGAQAVRVRGKSVELPTTNAREATAALGAVAEVNHVAVVMRALAETHRNDLLAQEGEWDRLLPAGAQQILMLDEWRHPDLCKRQKPSECATMRSLADCLAHADPALYVAEKPNTHWSNWPDGGSL